jgi:hypothetical protein
MLDEGKNKVNKDKKNCWYDGNMFKIIPFESLTVKSIIKDQSVMSEVGGAVVGWQNQSSILPRLSDGLYGQIKHLKYLLTCPYRLSDNLGITNM